MQYSFLMEGPVLKKTGSVKKLISRIKTKVLHKKYKNKSEAQELVALGTHNPSELDKIYTRARRLKDRRNATTSNNTSNSNNTTRNTQTSNNTTRNTTTSNNTSNSNNTTRNTITSNNRIRNTQTSNNRNKTKFSNGSAAAVAGVVGLYGFKKAADLTAETRAEKNQRKNT